MAANGTKGRLDLHFVTAACESKAAVTECGSRRLRPAAHRARWAANKTQSGLQHPKDFLAACVPRRCAAPGSPALWQVTESITGPALAGMLGKTVIIRPSKVELCIIQGNPSNRV
jgi:hypothetical protein